jgi:hypothetical protein
MAREIDFNQPLTEDEAIYVAQRPWLKRDAELEGIEIRYASEQEEPEDEDKPYTEWTFAELKDEVALRNASRDDDSKIVPKGRNGVAYSTALAEDDAANVEDDAE